MKSLTSAPVVSSLRAAIAGRFVCCACTLVVIRVCRSMGYVKYVLNILTGRPKINKMTVDQCELIIIGTCGIATSLLILYLVCSSFTQSQ